MGSLDTSLNFTSKLYATIERRTATPMLSVEGMPIRARYEADQGWDDLFAARPKKTAVRAGASAAEPATARAPAPRSGEREVGDLEV